MKKITLFLIILGISVSGRSWGQERVSSLVCESEGKSQSDRTEFSIVKRYTSLGKLTFEVSIKVQGEFEGEERGLSGSSTLTADPRSVNPLRPYFDVSDASGENRVAIKLLGGDLLREYDSEIPGSVVMAQVKTNDTEAPYLVLKGVIGTYQSGDERTLNASLFSKNGRNSLSLGNADLRCSYSVQD